MSVHTVSNMNEKMFYNDWSKLDVFQIISKTIKHVETIMFDRQTFFRQTFNLGILGYFDKKKNYFYFGGNLKIVVYYYFSNS